MSTGYGQKLGVREEPQLRSSTSSSVGGAYAPVSTPSRLSQSNAPGDFSRPGSTGSPTGSPTGAAGYAARPGAPAGPAVTYARPVTAAAITSASSAAAAAAAAYGPPVARGGYGDVGSTSYGSNSARTSSAGAAVPASPSSAGGASTYNPPSRTSSNASSLQISNSVGTNRPSAAASAYGGTSPTGSATAAPQVWQLEPMSFEGQQFLLDRRTNAIYSASTKEGYPELLGTWVSMFARRIAHIMLSPKLWSRSMPR